MSAPGTPEAQLSAANFHVASDEEIEGMEQTLEHYVIAFESLDLAGIQQVWPDMDKQHAKTFKNVFSAFRSSSSKPRVSLQCSIPNVADATADVHCSETVTYDAGKGKTKQAGPAKISLELKSQSGRWIVEEMKGI